MEETQYRSLPIFVGGIVTRSDLLKTRTRAHDEETWARKFFVPPFPQKLPSFKRGGP